MSTGTKEKETAWSQGRITVALREKFAPPEYAFLAGVPNGTGMQKSREADGVAMSLWPSRGLELIGFEIKSARGDWLNELKNPAKAEAICKFCDRWYVVTGATGIAKQEELPPTWGLMERRGEKLVITKEAPKLDPLPFSRPFLAGLLRRTQEQLGSQVTVSDHELDKLKRDRYEAGYDAAMKQAESKIQNNAQIHKQQLECLEREVNAFETASGISIKRYSGGRHLGEAVKIATRLDVEWFKMEIERVRRQGESIASSARQALEAADQLMTERAKIITEETTP